jgi:hypothetical protein
MMSLIPDTYSICQKSNHIAIRKQKTKFYIKCWKCLPSSTVYACRHLNPSSMLPVTRHTDRTIELRRCSKPRKIRQTVFFVSC